MSDIFVFGAGGHGKVAIEAIRAATPGITIGVIDDNPANWGKTLLGVPIVGGRDHACAHQHVALVPAIGDNRARLAMMAWASDAGLALATVIHPSAIVSPSAAIGAGCMLAPGAIVNAEARLGRGTIINTAASVDHDCVLGDAVHVAPGARLCGGVEIGAASMIGVGAIVVPGIIIGRGCTVGAGAVVVRPVADNTRVWGVPAVVREEFRSCPQP